jgi:hypothetical protein
MKNFPLGALLAALSFGGFGMPQAQYKHWGRTKRRAGYRQYQSPMELRIRAAQVRYAQRNSK